MASDVVVFMPFDFQDFSKVESGKLEIESIPFNLFDLLNDVEKVLLFALKKKTLNLVKDFSLSRRSSGVLGVFHP